MGSEAAAALSKLRWAKTTEEERKAHSAMMHEARWGKKKKAGKANSKKKPVKS